MLWLSDVPVPTDFGVNYEDLNLHTPDGIVLRSYLMRQRKDLGSHHAGKVEIDDDETDEEVSATHICVSGWLTISSVLCDAPDCFDVSREWWQPWTSYTPRKGVLR